MMLVPCESWRWGHLPKRLGELRLRHLLRRIPASRRAMLLHEWRPPRIDGTGVTSSKIGDCRVIENGRKRVILCSVIIMGAR
jgi:hypothetical protein